MNEVITNRPENIPLVEVQNLSNYLNDISAKEPKLHLSILPNIVSDCASVFMEFKKMKIDNAQFNQKCRILDDYLRGQIKNQKISIESDHIQKMQEINTKRIIELEKIDTYRTTKLAELEKEREVSISEIEHNTQRTLAEIKSNEKIRMEEIRVDYEKKRREQDNDLYKFQTELKEESRKFDKKYKAAKQEQAYRHNYIKELQDTCSYINKKIIKGKATTAEMDYCKYLMELQIKAFKDSFSFTQALCMVCSGEEND